MVNNWLWISQLMPAHCFLCGQTRPPAHGLCPDCYADLPRLPQACHQCGLPISAQSHAAVCGQCLRTNPPFEQTLCAYVYANPVRQLITQMKFSANLSLAGLLGELLCTELHARIGERPEALLPVPLHPRRLRQRGFNQSIELARPLARSLQVPLLLDAVERQLDTPAQTGLDKRQRRTNLRHAFAVRQPLPRHVAIVDDVITTGQTVTALARCLKQAGIKRVDCYSVARALSPATK
ncbi:MAG: ComF family protein [Gammaproteobacteria bacterium]